MCPTGLLTSMYRLQFDDAVWETLHTAFLIPPARLTYTINWDLALFDIIILDEISMVSKRSFDHIKSTLNELYCRPMLIVAGDGKQMKPLQTEEGITKQVTSVLESHHVSTFKKFKLNTFDAMTKGYPIF